MRKFGLIGYPLSHSFSKSFFQKKFSDEGLEDADYDLFPFQDLSLLESWLTDNTNLRGFNVTIPHKINIISFLDYLDDTAAAIGAVNCVDIRYTEKGRQLYGYNTDAIGFKRSLLPLLKKHHQHALVLGSGGASKAVIQVLKELGINYQIVSRGDKGLNYEDIDEQVLKKHQLIINTTPLGMFPNIEDAPKLPYQWINSSHYVYDLVYNPQETLLLKKAKTNGATIKNGLEMLMLQAEASWEIWNK